MLAASRRHLLQTFQAKPAGHPEEAEETRHPGKVTLSPADIADIRLGGLQRRLVDDEPGRDIENDASNSRLGSGMSHLCAAAQPLDALLPAESIASSTSISIQAMDVLREKLDPCVVIRLPK